MQIRNVYRHWWLSSKYLIKAINIHQFLHSIVLIQWCPLLWNKQDEELFEDMHESPERKSMLIARDSGLADVCKM